MKSRFETLCPYRLSNSFWKTEIIVDNTNMTIGDFISSLLGQNQEPLSMPPVLSCQISLLDVISLEIDGKETKITCQGRTERSVLQGLLHTIETDKALPYSLFYLCVDHMMEYPGSNAFSFFGYLRLNDEPRGMSSLVFMEDPDDKSQTPLSHLIVLSEEDGGVWSNEQDDRLAISLISYQRFLREHPHGQFIAARAAIATLKEHSLGLEIAMYASQESTLAIALAHGCNMAVLKRLDLLNGMIMVVCVLLLFIIALQFK